EMAFGDDVRGDLCRRVVMDESPPPDRACSPSAGPTGKLQASAKTLTKWWSQSESNRRPLECHPRQIRSSYGAWRLASPFACDRSIATKRTTKQCSSLRDS